MTSSHTFARRAFRWAGIYGLIVLLPQYFMEGQIGRDFPPAITHPEHFYGFIGVAVAWQFAFLTIARDPVRFRPLMLPAILEKLSFGIAAIVLFAMGRIPLLVLAPALVDLGLATAFAVAYRSTRT
ncbi:MAG: hypothetical protein AB7Q16_23150 [Vicinamibacterales bacterium]